MDNIFAEFGSSFVRSNDAVNNHLCVTQFGYHDFTNLTASDAYLIQSYFSLHFIIEGRGTLYIGDKKYSLSSGDIFIIPPDVLKSYFPDKTMPWKYVWLAFYGKAAPQYCKNALFDIYHPVFKSKYKKEIINTLFSLFKICESPKTMNSLFALSALYKVFAILTNERNPVVVSSSANAYISQTISIIEKNYCNPNLRVETICQELFISHSYLCAIFKKILNIPLSKYLIRYRLQKACELLKSTDLTVNSIARTVGYSDIGHFLKSFKAAYSMTPSEYRLNNVPPPRIGF